MCFPFYKNILDCGNLGLVLTCNTGDEERPRCKRCDVKDLPCERPTKKTIFRHGAKARFAKDQKWVNTSAKQCEFPTSKSIVSPNSLIQFGFTLATQLGTVQSPSVQSPVPNRRRSQLYLPPRKKTFIAHLFLQFPILITPPQP